VFKGYLNARQEDYGWGGIVGIVNADGTSPRVLSQWPFQHRYESDQDARWAPDGRSVVYEHMRFTGTDSHGGFLFASDFTQVDLRTGARFVVRGGHDPTFGPHGLMYVAPRGVFVNRRLFVRGKFDESDVASWSPNSKQLLFSASGRFEVINANGRIRRQISHVIRNAVFARWAPHGTRIAYDSSIGNSDPLYTANADGSHPVRLPDSQLGGVDFRWSPDGRHIAYTTPGDGLHLVSADGSKPQLINRHGFVFAWSPNGRRIAYLTLSSEPANPMFIANADGSNSTEFPTQGGTELVWSPDSIHLVVDGTLIDATTRDTISLDAWGAAWSPDSSLIAFGSGDGIDIARADGTAVRHISLCTS
jgi:Tol biopolymer transport system component